MKKLRIGLGSILPIIGFLLVGVIISKTSFLEHFSIEQQLTLLLLFIAIFLWITAPIPTAASSILIISLMMVFNIAGSVEEAFAGFLTPALYFILVLSLISKALVEVEVDQVFAKLLIKFSKGGPILIVLGLPIAILLMPIILPSAVARFKIMFPLMNSINHFYGYQDKSIFHKYSIFLIGMVNQNATLVIFTGGGFPILAHQILKDYNVTNLSWLEWIRLLAPPLWIGSILMVLIIWYFLKILHPNDNLAKASSFSQGKIESQDKKLPFKFWVTLLSFFIMILAWIFTDEEIVPLILPPMLLIVFYAMPKMGLITNKMIREYDWENFLMLGASFSLGMLLMKNGTAEAVANLLITFIPGNTGIVIKVIIIAVIVFILRFCFIVPSAAIVVIFPIVMSYSELIGIPQIQLALLVIIIVGSGMVLPIHSTTIYLAFETGILSKKEQYSMGFLFSLVLMVISILSTLYYW
ncbi:SLC13 family permease [Oceanobacillus damuensis]|uniref:SLC13 family permease n=1 Tax=Oceanobacillus damuensis TaxID=937928 RepID=UPI000AAAF3FC|nr:SLC13 family permease [Oceanobacillus damuensis]